MITECLGGKVGNVFSPSMRYNWGGSFMYNYVISGKWAGKKWTILGCGDILGTIVSRQITLLLKLKLLQLASYAWHLGIKHDNTKLFTVGSSSVYEYQLCGIFTLAKASGSKVKDPSRPMHSQKTVNTSGHDQQYILSSLNKIYTHPFFPPSSPSGHCTKKPLWIR